MMGRSRSKARANWPANLYPNRNGFKYRHPVTKKETWMGEDRVRAFDAARKLNALLTPRNDLVTRATVKSETVADAIRVFRAEDMPGRDWAPKTAENYESIINRTEKKIGDRELIGFTVRECATFLREVTESPRSRQQFRLVLSWIFACAIEEGWIDNNPALQTRKVSYKRQRARLTKEMYDAIWDRAEPWLRNAMDISLITLLRRDDVVSLRFQDVHDDHLWVIPAKTEGTTGARLKIKMGGSLPDVIARCRDAVVSPFLVHRLPDKARPRDLRAKMREHHTQVLPEQLTRAFADARDAAGVAMENPPTFHEIRSLGGALLRDQGWTVAQIQALMTHANESMTDHYLADHDAPWSEVETGVHLTR